MRRVVAAGLVVVLVATAVLPVAIGGQSTTDDGERPIDIDTDRVNVYLQAQRTEIDHGQSAIFVHSATNYVTNREPLTVQLLIEAPSGSDVFGTAGVESASGSQFSTVTTLDPGEQESMRINAEFHEPGEYDVTAEAIYYFGENRSDGDAVRVTIPIEQRPPPPSTTERAVRTVSESLSVYGSLVTTLASPLPAPGASPVNVLAPWLFLLCMYVLGTYAFALIATLLLWFLTGVIGITSFPGDSDDDWSAAQGLALFVAVGGTILALLDLLSVLGSGDMSLLTARLLAVLLLAIGLLVVLNLGVLPLAYLWARVTR